MTAEVITLAQREQLRATVALHTKTHGQRVADLVGYIYEIAGLPRTLEGQRPEIMVGHVVEFQSKHLPCTHEGLRELLLDLVELWDQREQHDCDSAEWHDGNQELEGAADAAVAADMEAARAKRAEVSELLYDQSKWWLRGQLRSYGVEGRDDMLDWTHQELVTELLHCEARRAPAPAVSTPVPQADAGTVQPEAVPAPRDDEVTT